MTDSSDVLGLMKVVYVAYLAVVFSLIGLYVFGITRKHKVKPGFKVPIYGWIALLVFTGVGIHLMTFNQIPWVKWDLNRDEMPYTQEFNIAMSDYQFRLPQEQLLIKEGEMVRFNVDSDDYTYGFGLFRENGSMVFQMQVVPGHPNSIVWKFDESDTYSIRSTEYSGPKGGSLLAEDAVVITSDPALHRIISEQSSPQS